MSHMLTKTQRGDLGEAVSSSSRRAAQEAILTLQPRLGSQFLSTDVGPQRTKSPLGMLTPLAVGGKEADQGLHVPGTERTSWPQQGKVGFVLVILLCLLDLWRKTLQCVEALCSCNSFQTSVLISKSF